MIVCLREDSLVDYGTDISYGSSSSDPALTISHSINLTGLNPSTTYHFAVTSANNYGFSSSSTDSTFTTLTPAPPVISALSVSSVTGDSAMITWTTDQQADSLVEYGTTVLYEDSVSDPTLNTGHSIVLLGLTPGTPYYFMVTSTNTYSLSSSSGDSTFTTSSPITVTITLPLDNDTINRADVLVRGTVSNSTGNETGINVNGMVATVYSGEFFVNHVPLSDGQNVITATANDTAGNIASHAILVNAVTTDPHLTLNANIESGIAPLTTYFSVMASIPDSIVSYEFDYEGDSVVDYTGTTFDDINFTYSTEGIYYPTVTVTDDQSNTYSDTIAIVVLNQTDLDTLLQAKWNAMKSTLANQDIAGAINQFISVSQNRYQNIFTTLYNDLPDIVSNMQSIEMIYIEDGIAQYRIKRVEDEGTVTYYIYFVTDESGVWKIKQF